MLERIKEFLIISAAIAIGVFWGLFWWFLFLFVLDLLLAGVSGGPSIIRNR